MLVSELLEYAVNTDIANLSVAAINVEDEDRIKNEQKLISYINLALISIYKKFNLNKGKQILTNVVNGKVYNASSDFMYIRNVTYTDNLGDMQEVPVNDEFCDFTVFTDRPLIFSIKKDDSKYADVTELDLHYIGSADLVSRTTSVIPLPQQFVEPILLFISYKAHSPINSSEATQVSDPHYVRYLGACNEIRNKSMVNPDNDSNVKFRDRGFV